MNQFPHPLSEIEGSSSHEQVDCIADCSFQGVTRHAEVLLQMPDHGFDTGSAPEAVAGFTALMCGVVLFRTARSQDFRVSNLFVPFVPAITDGALRTGSRYLPCLLQNFRQRVPVVNVLFKGHRSHNDSAGFGHNNGSFTSEFIFFVGFAFADTRQIGLMQAVDFMFVRPLLFVNLSKKLYFFLWRVRASRVSLRSSSRMSTPAIVLIRLSSLRRLERLRNSCGNSRLKLRRSCMPSASAIFPHF